MTIEILFGDNVRNIDDSCFWQDENGKCVDTSLHGESESLSYVKVRDEYILLNGSDEVPKDAKSRPATEEEEQKFSLYFRDLIAYAKSTYAQFMFNVSDNKVSLSCAAPNEAAKPYYENVTGEKQFFSMEDSDNDNKPDKVVMSGKERSLTIAGDYVTRLQPKLAAISKRISETRCE